MIICIRQEYLKSCNYMQIIYIRSEYLIYLFAKKLLRNNYTKNVNMNVQ